MAKSRNESLIALLLSTGEQLRDAPAFETLAEPALAAVLDRARAFAEARKHQELTAEHFVLALAVDDEGQQVLDSCGASPEVVRVHLAQFLERGSIPIDWGTLFRLVLALAHFKAHLTHRRITSARVLEPILGMPSYAREVLTKQGVTRLALLEYIAHGIVHRRDAAKLPVARVVAGAAPARPTPSRYEIVVHNDDWTEVAFVIEVLETVFDVTDAPAVAQTVHASGSAAIGSYDMATALAKIERATKMARAREFPLMLSIRALP